MGRYLSLVLGRTNKWYVTKTKKIYFNLTIFLFLSSSHSCISAPTKSTSSSNIVMLTSIRKLSVLFQVGSSMSNLLSLIASSWKTLSMPSKWLLIQLKVQSKFRFKIKKKLEDAPFLTYLNLSVIKSAINLCYHNKKTRIRICICMIIITVHILKILLRLSKKIIQRKTRHIHESKIVAGNVFQGKRITIMTATSSSE